MKVYGLIGKSIVHSFSKNFFEKKFENEGIVDCKYENFPLQHISGFRGLIENNPELKGLNVTIPYKQQIIPFLDDLDKSANEVGAVNTVKIDRIESRILLKGFNTDIIGFRDSLLPLLQVPVKSALVLGTGGASHAVAYVLGKLNIEVIFVSRKGNRPEVMTYKELDKEIISKNLLIINTTPLGTFPNISGYPEIPYSYIAAKHTLYDLVYNPKETVFLQKGKSRGARIKNGYEMLEKQAIASWNIWNDNT